jgi:GTP-binding protein HflX
VEYRLEEAVNLARAIGLNIVHSQVVTLVQPRPATLLGAGKVAALESVVAALGVDVVIIDGQLSAVQQRNLERAWRCKVIDRTALILEIFGERARTREGRLQVELAALSYQRSRLVRSWTHLERQRGGFGFMGGPGETQIEADRRQIRNRITRLKRELEGVSRTRGLHRTARRRVPYPIIALVGYTNAGKSTLFNRLTGAAVGSGERLFETLDPTMRGVKLPSGQRAILSDTVGFISDLPHDLVAAFHATLEEVVEADVIVHVRDIANPDAAAQRDDVHRVLTALGLESKVEAGLVEVLNKIDLLTAERRAQFAVTVGREPLRVLTSAATGESLESVLDAMAESLGRLRRMVELKVAFSDGATVAWLYRHGQVISRTDDETHAHFKVLLSPADAERVMSRRGVLADPVAALA